VAKIEELVRQISDAKLRDEIASEIKELKKQKRFGLVFEEHLPEMLRLPKAKIRLGNLVANRDATGSEVWRVIGINGKKAKCRQPVTPGKYDQEIIKEFRLEELVLVVSFGEPIYPILTPIDRVQRGGPDKPWHVLINADNYHALQLLLYSHERKVDVIYIDPPYNNRARDWKYNNDYVDPTDAWRHSKWLSMMKKRLLLAKRLLKRDGVLAITIDENEVYHLGTLLEQLFPSHLHQQVTMVINPKGTGKLNFARVDEYALFCIPNTGKTIISGSKLPKGSAPIEDDLVSEEELADATDESQIELVEADQRELEVWDKPFPPEETDEWELRHARRRGSESSYRHQRKNQFYPIYVDVAEKKIVRVGESLLPLEAKPSFEKKDALTPLWPIDEEGNDRCWRFIPTTMQKLVDAGRVILGKYNVKRGTWTVNLWERKPTEKKAKTLWWQKPHDAGTHGTTLLHKILGVRNAFPFPKSIHAVRDTLAIVVGNRRDALILDFFAGSGTTYQATAMLNAEDNGKRRCILVSYNEVPDKAAKTLQKQGLHPGDPDFEMQGICEAVTWPRCRNVTSGRRPDGKIIEGKYAKDTPLAGRPYVRGLEENIEYFRLDFADPSDVERGDAFEGILPILWLMAGAIGERDSRRGTTPWFIPRQSPFAVLIQETKFREFQKELRNRRDLTTIFLVTDSDDNFDSMRRELGQRYHCVQLYKSYLENFRINTVDRHAAGHDEGI